MIEASKPIGYVRRLVFGLQLQKLIPSGSTYLPRLAGEPEGSICVDFDQGGNA